MQEKDEKSYLFGTLVLWPHLVLDYFRNLSILLYSLLGEKKNT